MESCAICGRAIIKTPHITCSICGKTICNDCFERLSDKSKCPMCAT